jgi:hypothetical protein
MQSCCCAPLVLLLAWEQEGEVGEVQQLQAVALPLLQVLRA